MRLLLLDQGLSRSTIHQLRAVGVFSCSWITWTVSGNALPIDFLAISDAQEQNHQTVVFDLADEPVIAHAIFPELSKPRAVQRLSDAAWIVQLGNPLIKELQDALAVLRVEFAEFPVNLGCQLNAVGHDVSGRP